MENDNTSRPLRAVPEHVWQPHTLGGRGERLSVVQAAREHATTARRSSGMDSPAPAIANVEVPPELASVGDIVFEQHTDDASGATTFRITRADPHILISLRLISRLERGQLPYARLDIRHREGSETPVRTVTFSQDSGTDYIYVLGEEAQHVGPVSVRCVQARWPD